MKINKPDPPAVVGAIHQTARNPSKIPMATGGVNFDISDIMSSPISC